MGISLVNQATNSATIAGSTLAVTVTAPTNGNTMIVCVVNGGSATTSVSSISLTGVASWSSALVGTANGSGSFQNLSEIWFGLVGAGAGTSLTINFAATAKGRFANVSEWSGVLTSSPLDGTGSKNNQSTTTTPSTAAYSTGTANDLVIAFLSGSGQSTVTTGPSGYTALNGGHTSGSGLSVFCVPYFQVVAGSGAQSASWTISPGNSTTALLQGFKPAATTASDPPYNVVFQPTFANFNSIVCV